MVKEKEDCSVMCQESSIVRFERCEALKLAYELAHKINHFSSSHAYSTGHASIQEDINDVLKIADMNLKYIMSNDRNEK